MRYFRAQLAVNDPYLELPHTSHHARTDVTALLPMGKVVAEMVPDNPGIGLFHCHLSNHLRMGMQMRYEVTH